MGSPAENFVAHYSSENYDPVKAHEYYLKNRELKGRQTTSGMSDTQKEAWAYTKHKIGNDKKAELESVESGQKAKIEALRQKAMETRARIEEKLSELLKKLSSTKTKPLNVIPENASRQTKLRLYQQNKEITRRNQEISAKASDVARKAAGQQLKQVGVELKEAVVQARTSYADAKKQLVAKYAAATDAEYENIRTKLPSAPPKAPAVKKAPAAKKTPTTRKRRKASSEQETV